MKSGILTFHRTANYGSCLQAYALYKKVINLGYDCELIDYRCEAVESRESIGTKKSFKSIKSYILQMLEQKISKKKYKGLMDFLYKNAKIGKEYFKNNIIEANKEYDKFIVGSDIVWGTDITEGDYTYFLDFVKEDDKKFAFSSSIGNCERIKGEEKEKISKLLKSFNKISVREADAACWTEEITKKQVDLVCDPTMLLEAKEWDEIVSPKTKKKNYVLIYFVDEKSKIFKDAISYANKNGLKVYFITKSIKPIKGVRILRPSTLSEFLGLIKGANFVFTASYHGLLFSLYYHKEFLYYKRAHSSRVVSLAQRFGIEGRCGNEYDTSSCKSIDYENIDKLIEEFRDSSTQVLQEILQR